MNTYRYETVRANPELGAEVRERCLSLLQQEYLEKLYFYSLKKTGNKHDAEDLAQDIATQAIISLMNGSVPHEFAYWLWTIARNRYARWAAGKNRTSSVHVPDKERVLTETPDNSASIEDHLILKESLALLKRELSLLSSYYREITVAYYIKGDNIRDIAAKLNLPAGTIKRKLYESRKNIREGMHMARETGQRSFLAENITFSKSGYDGKKGGPWPLIQRKIPKNILLAAYRNPLTLEELCLEMGISMPYMEEEVKLLADGTLLKEVGKGRFETDFIIVDKAMQLDIFHKLDESGERFSPLLLELLDSELEKIRAVDFIGCQMSTDELYWTLIPRFVDLLSGKVKQVKQVPSEYTERPYQGRWDIVGYEECRLPFETSSGHNGTGSDYGTMWAYKLKLDNMWNRAGELLSHEVNVLANAIRSGKSSGSLGDAEKQIVRHLTDRGFVKEGANPVTPTFPAWTREQGRKLEQVLESSPLFGQLHAIMLEHYDYTYNKIGQHVPDRLVNQLKFVTGTYLYNYRMIGIRFAFEHNRISIPDDIAKSTLSMYMELN